AFDGSGLRLVEAPFPKLPMVVFDRVGVDGPFALYPDGSICDSVGGTLVAAEFRERPLMRMSYQVSNGGSRLVAAAGLRDLHCIDLSAAKPAWRPLGNADTDRFLVGPAADYAVSRRVQLRRQMQSIGINEHGDLVLTSNKQKSIVIDKQRHSIVYVG